MGLDVVRPKDCPKGRTQYIKDDAQSLRTHDIEGARPSYPGNRFYRDGPAPKARIPGATSRTYYPEVNRQVDLSMTTHDIPDAQPNVVKFKTPRVVNPLAPSYELPSVRRRPVTPPQPAFHDGLPRDTLDHADWSKARILERDYARDPNEARDIEHSQPNLRQRVNRGPPRDVDKTVERSGGRVLSSKCQRAADSPRGSGVGTPRGPRAPATPRMTCPLDPSYSVPSRTLHPFRRHDPESALLAPAAAGVVEGSTSRVLHRDNGEPQASLLHRDIPGAVSQRYKGLLPYNIYDPPEVTPFARGLDVSDIEGTAPGTRRPRGPGH